MQKNKERKRLTTTVPSGKRKVRGTEKGADCNTKSTFRDTRFSFCSLGLTKKPKMLFVILKFTKVDLNARLLKKTLSKNASEVQVKISTVHLQTL